MAYPEKYKTEVVQNITTIKWINNELKSNNFKNFVLNIPIFNEKCKGMVSFFNNFFRMRFT